MTTCTDDGLPVTTTPKGVFVRDPALGRRGDRRHPRFGVDSEAARAIFGG